MLGVCAQARDPVPVETSHGTRAAQTTSSETVPKDAADVEFLVEALNTGLAEVQMGELAQQRGGTPALREYGQKLQADHATSVQELKRMLATLNVVIPSAPTVEAESRHAALARLSGAQFDAAFVRLMIASHEEAIEKYGAQTHANPNEELSLFAAKALPVLREHLQIAQSLRAGPSAARP
jgi:putative membrane protein